MEQAPQFVPHALNVLIPYDVADLLTYPGIWVHEPSVQPIFPIRLRSTEEAIRKYPSTNKLIAALINEQKVISRKLKLSQVDEFNQASDYRVGLSAHNSFVKIVPFPHSPTF